MALTLEQPARDAGVYLARHQVPIAAGADKIIESAMVHAQPDGFAVKVGDSGGLGASPVLGIAEVTADNSGGTDGERSVWLKMGLFWRKLSSTNPPDESHARGSTVYAEDDETISTDSTLPVAGTCWRVEPSGVEDERGALVLIGAESKALQALKTTFDPLPLGAWTLVDGTPLAIYAGGGSATPGLDMLDSKAAVIHWDNNATPAKIVTSYAVPGGLDPDQDMFILFPGGKIGATAADEPTLGVEVFFHPVGSAYDADADAGGSTLEFLDSPGTKVVQVRAVTIDAADIPDPSAGDLTMTITVQPEAGELDTDELFLLTPRVIGKLKL